MNIGFLEANLLAVLSGIFYNQKNHATVQGKNVQNYEAEIEQIREYIEVAGEYGVAYESLVSLIESYPVKLTGLAAVKLLEVGLLMRFKTERDEDACFDSRKSPPDS